MPLKPGPSGKQQTSYTLSQVRSSSYDTHSESEAVSPLLRTMLLFPARNPRDGRDTPSRGVSPTVLPPTTSPSASD